MFRPQIISSEEKNPYESSYTLSKESVRTINGQQFRKITYTKDRGILWRVGHCALGILASLAVIPLFVDFKTIKKIFGRVKSGQETTVLLIKLNSRASPNEETGSPTRKPLANTNAVKPNYEDGAPLFFIKRQQEIETAFQKANFAYEEGETVQKRREHPPSIKDTIRNNAVSDYYTDDEILFHEEIVKIEILPFKISSVTGDGPILKNIQVFYTKNNKAVLIQQASKASGAALAFMLISDNKEVLSTDIFTKQAIDDPTLDFDWLRNAGVPTISEKFSCLENLRDAIEKNGSAIVEMYMNGDVIVDEVSKELDKVRLRDPCHGWEITVSAKSFLAKDPSVITQINKKSIKKE